MFRHLLALAALVHLAGPLAAQIGLASPAQSLVLTATKHGSVGVSLSPGAGEAGSGIAAAWDLDSSRNAPVSLVAYIKAGSRTVIVLPSPAAVKPAGQLAVRIDPATLPDLPPAGNGAILYLQAITQ